MSLQNGITEEDAALTIPLTTYRFAVHVETAATVDVTAAFLERVADAIWKAFPDAEDGDVFVTVADQR